MERKDGGKGTKKGKDGKGKGSKKGKGKEQTNIKCPWFQTEYNFGRTCWNGEGCWLLHEKVRSQQEYDNLSKPWGSPSQAGSEKSQSSAKAFASAADYNLYCRKYLECPGRSVAIGGDGSCTKTHCAEGEAKAHISRWKKEVRNPGATPPPSVKGQH